MELARRSLLKAAAGAIAAALLSGATRIVPVPSRPKHEPLDLAPMFRVGQTVYWNARGEVTGDPSGCATPFAVVSKVDAPRGIIEVRMGAPSSYLESFGINAGARFTLKIG